MSTTIIIGIVVLLGGFVGVFLYLRAKKRKEEEERKRREEEERKQREAQTKKEMEQERKRLRQKAEEETEKRIKAMKAESDAKIARLERSARKAEKRRMERPRRRGTKEEGRDFREMLLMIATILFKRRSDENIRKTKQILATIRAGTADKETVKRWKSAWKLAKVKIRQRKEKRARRLAEIRAKKAAKREGVRLDERRRRPWRPRKPSFRRPNPRPKWTRDAQGRKRLPDGRVWMGGLGWRWPKGHARRPRPVRGGHRPSFCKRLGGCGGGRFRMKTIGKLKLRPKRKLRPKKKAEIY